MKTKIDALKVLNCSLAAEARIIRRKEIKLRGDRREFLRHHRVHEVRPHARAANIALAIMHGRTYEQCEGSACTLFDAIEVDRLLDKFGACKDSEESTANYEARKEVIDDRFDQFLKDAAVLVPVNQAAREERRAQRAAALAARQAETAGV